MERRDKNGVGMGCVRRTWFPCFFFWPQLIPLATFLEKHRSQICVRHNERERNSEGKLKSKKEEKGREGDK